MARFRWLLLGALAAGPLAAQSVGQITGTVRDRQGEALLVGARVVVDNGRYVVTTDQRGVYRFREVPAGWHSVTASSIGYRPVKYDSVLVRSGQYTPLSFLLEAQAVEVEGLQVIGERIDSVLDPLAVADAQRFTAEELRRLPVTTVEEAIALSAGAVGESYRGGRLGQQAFIVDGLGLKNQLDASSGGLGLRVPPDLLAEASLISNGFSARYGQAVSALVNLSTRDGADRWGGRVAYETDRPLGGGGDFGLDRAVLSAEGPLPRGIRVIGVADLSGRLDADPVSAPRPSDPRDPRSSGPALLPHNSGEQYDLAGKVTIPLGSARSLRILGLHSTEQRLLYDPLYKYDSRFAPARRVTGDHLNLHFQNVFTRPNIIADARFGYFGREFLRGELANNPGYAFGAFTGERYRILGEDIARAQDTAGARNPLPGFFTPTLSDNTPWGVPAYFMGGASRGDLGWNRYRELKGRLDLSIAAGTDADFYVGAEYTGQRVRTFQRVLGFLPVGDSVPAASAATFSPWAGAIYSEIQARKSDLAFTAGIRYDQFKGRTDLPNRPAQVQRALSPRASVSTVFRGATFVVSYGQFRQAPDYQYLVDAAFDDTTRTGRFRQGNPDLGFEKSTQYEFSLRVRPTPATSARANLYVKRLQGLVASVPFGTDPDSSIFGNADAGSVKGLELIFEREFRGDFGVRVSYTLQQAEATSTSAFLLRQAIKIDPVTGDTIFPAKVEFPLDFDRRHTLTAILTGVVPAAWGPSVAGVKPLAGLEGTAIFRIATGLPFSRVAPGTDSLIGVPNDSRLPSQSTLDLLLRRPLRFGRFGGSLYLDMRNVLNRQNLVAVRRDTGTPRISASQFQAMVDAAYQAHPEPIPYESPRYRPWADLDRNGYVEGAAELMPLYQRAVRDVTQPLFAYGAPRLVRMGMELSF
jgi:carboxypeptidase family protein